VVYATVVTALLMITVDQTSVATALSTLQSALGTSFAWTSWTISAYAAGQIVAFPIAGGLADQHGRKRTLQVAILVFSLASLACGMAQGIVMLIVFRFVQGLAGGAFIPAATGIIADHFPRDRDRAIGLFASIVPIGAIAGPIVGGLIVETVGWRWIFFVNVPLGAALLVIVAAKVGESAHRRAPPVDWLGITLLVTMLLSGMDAATRSSTLGTGWLAPVSVALTATIAVAAAWLLLRHCGNRPEALIPVALLQARFALIPMLAGGLLALRAVGMIAASAVGVALIRKLGSRPLLLGGFAAHSLGLLMLVLVPAHVNVYLWIGVAATVSGIGVGLASPASNNATMHLAPDLVSSASGLRGMFRQAGAILAISAVTAAVTASDEPVVAQMLSLATLAAVLLVAVPVALRIPNHRGRW
jgi:MFS family permease